MSPKPNPFRRPDESQEDFEERFKRELDESDAGGDEPSTGSEDSDDDSAGSE